MADLPLILGLGGCLVAAVFLAAAEAALLRVPRVRVAVLSDRGDARARRLLRLIDELPAVMNTVLLAVLLAQIAAATLTGVLAARHLRGLGITVASVLLTLVLFVYAEAIPKTYAVRHPVAVARRVAGPVAALTWVLHPVVAALVWFADLQAPGRGIAGRPGVTEEELRRLAADAATAGEIDQSDAELMERAFALGDARVDEVMVPRVDVVGVAAAASHREALDIALASGHRRLPVYQGDLDSIVGVVRIRELVAAGATRGPGTVGRLGSAPLVVPESKRVIELLREMQQTGVHFAVAVDEHGGTAGIVTIEDVVAELVGEIADEGEPRPAPIRLVAEHLVVDAAADVDDLAARLGADLPRGDYHTVGGLVLDVAGRIPRVGETVEIAGHTFRVLKGSRHRVRRIEVS